MSGPCEVRGLTVTAAGRRLLDDVSLRLAPGEVTVVVGENGAGKSTLLDCLTGLRRASLGEVLVGGEALLRRRPRERACLVASLGQHDVAAPDLAVAARIGHGLAPRRGPQALLDEAALAKVREVAAELEVAHLLGRRLGTLSGGERRRVEVARALVDDQAGAYVLDEPHAGVDARHQRAVSEALRRRAERGAVVVVTVHDLGAALSLAGRVVGLREGRVVVDATGPEAIDGDTLERLYGVRGEVLRSASGALAVVLQSSALSRRPMSS